VIEFDQATLNPHKPFQRSTAGPLDISVRTFLFPKFMEDHLAEISGSITGIEGEHAQGSVADIVDIERHVLIAKNIIRGFAKFGLWSISPWIGARPVNWSGAVTG
jgi:hypothetical protein